MQPDDCTKSRCEKLAPRRGYNLRAQSAGRDARVCSWNLFRPMGKRNRYPIGFVPVGFDVYLNGNNRRGQRAVLGFTLQPLHRAVTFGVPRCVSWFLSFFACSPSLA